MKQIKIFCYPSHCDGKHVPGVDYARIIRPMQELAKQPGFKVTIYNGEPGLDWRKIAKNYDILYLNYITNAFGFVIAASEFDRLGKKVVFDIDDLIWEIQTDNSAYNDYAPGSEGRATITDIVARGCNYATCTNQYLKHGIAEFTGKDRNAIKVFPNYIDLELYSWNKKAEDKPEIKIGYFGSSSHFNDLVNPGFIKGMEKLMDNYPQVTFFTIGAFIQSIKKRFSSRYTSGFGDHDIYKWIKMMPLFMSDVDIVVAPLVENTYTKAKSGIKYLEYSSMKIPGVYQNIRQYIELVEHGENGFLASQDYEWYSNLSSLVESVELRQKMGEAAYKNVKENYTIQKNVEKYVEFFKSIA